MYYYDKSLAILQKEEALRPNTRVYHLSSFSHNTARLTELYKVDAHQYILRCWNCIEKINLSTNQGRVTPSDSVVKVIYSISSKYCSSCGILQKSVWLLRYFIVDILLNTGVIQPQNEIQSAVCDSR